MIDTMPRSLFQWADDKDEKRLGKQLSAVRDYMWSHDWVTLVELEKNIEGTAASLSARIRDLRKLRYKIEKKRITDGQYAYRLDRSAA